MSTITASIIGLLLPGLAVAVLPVPGDGGVACHGLIAPDRERVVRPFGPVGRWQGHWGVDLAAPVGSAVAAIGAGVVSFSGPVVDTLTVTVDHGGGVRTSYSYLATASVRRGQQVVAGQTVGRSGLHDGAEAFHLSLRLGAQYLDPMVLLRCRSSPWPALFLEAPGLYPRADVRDPRRHVRPPALRPPGPRQRGPRATRRHGGAARPRG